MEEKDKNLANSSESTNDVSKPETEELTQEQKASLEDAQKRLEERDSESRYRKTLPKFWDKLVTAVSVIFVLYHVFTSGFGMPVAYKHSTVHLAFVLALVFILYPAGKRSNHKRPSVIDMILAVLAIACAAYMYNGTDQIALRVGRAVTMDYVVAFVGTLLVLEACRRCVGKSLLIISIIALLYAYLGPYMPVAISHQGYSLSRIAYQMYLTSQGIFGIPLGVSAQYMVLFVFFASVLARTGMGKLFNDFAVGIAGRAPGGPAKVAVISSGLLGMINGSGAANVATTGVLTIPLMKKTGYPGHYAAAVEAAASTGGQIMPPVMGATAFIVAEYTAISYGKIMLAATIPAVFYFLSIFFVVDFRAKKAGLKGLPEELIPNYKETVKQYWHMLLPIILLIWLMIDGHSATFAAFYSLVFTFVLSFLRKSTRMTLPQLLEILTAAARDSLSVAVAMATAGIIVGVLTITGLGLIIADCIVKVAGSSLFLALVMVMFITIILGMGLPTSAAFVVAASISASVLMGLGIGKLEVYMFLLYFSGLSSVTPPVALSSYVAAGIANANMGKVGWTALRLAAAGFIIPFFFVYDPALLLIADSGWSIVLAAITGCIGIFLLAAASEGYYFGTIKWWMRIPLLAGALLLINPGLSTDLMGIGIAVLCFFVVKLMNRNKQTTIPA